MVQGPFRDFVSAQARTASFCICGNGRKSPAQCELAIHHFHHRIMQEYMHLNSRVSDGSLVADSLLTSC